MDLKIFESGFTFENCELFEKKHSVGITARTKSKKTIFETDREIYIEIQVINKEQCKMIKPIGFNSLDIKPKVKDLLVSKKPAIFFKDRMLYYSPEIGETKNIDFTKFSVITYDPSACVCDMKAEYELRTKQIQAIAKKFGIDANEYNFIIPIISRLIFCKVNKHIRGTEKITTEESKILNSAYIGAMKYAKKGSSICNAVKYDINSFYPYIMCKSEFKFPVSQGLIKKTKKSYPLEIRHLKIIGDHKYFKRSEGDYYDTYQIELLNLLGVKYEETDRTKLCYEQPINAKELFGYFDELYELKLEGNKYAKEMMNATHGLLSKKKEFEIPGNSIREDQKPYVVDYDEKRDVWLLSCDQPFKYDYGRIKTFLNSYVRLYIVKHYLIPLEQKGHQVYLSNVDSFVTDAKEDQIRALGINFSKLMGDIKIENVYEGFWEIEHIHKVVDVNIFTDQT